MQIYDISQELFTCCVYPGDPVPHKEQVKDIKNGDIYNLTNFSMCAHNGTHVDAPYHFYKNGRTIDQLELHKMIGDAYVIEFSGEMTAGEVDRLMEKAPKRILIKGNAIITLEAARAMTRHGVLLIGVESQTLGPENAIMDVHLELLAAETVILEGIRLHEVPEGKYLLNAAPINLGGADGAPCRAVLLDFLI